MIRPYGRGCYYFGFLSKLASLMNLSDEDSIVKRDTDYISKFYDSQDIAFEFQYFHEIPVSRINLACGPFAYAHSLVKPLDKKYSLFPDVGLITLKTSKNNPVSILESGISELVLFYSFYKWKTKIMDDDVFRITTCFDSSSENSSWADIVDPNALMHLASSNGYKPHYFSLSDKN